jgi:hypothetical protein
MVFSRTVTLPALSSFLLRGARKFSRLRAPVTQEEKSMAGIRLLERMLGSMSGVEAAPIPEVRPRETSLPVPVAPQPMPEMRKRWWK